MVIFKFFGLDQVTFGAKKVATCLTKGRGFQIVKKKKIIALITVYT